METPVDFSTWCARMMQDVMEENQDVKVFCDSAKSYRFGPVGAGKSNKAHLIVRVFDPWSPLRMILVPVDAIPEYEGIVRARRRYQVMWVDEARWFIGKEYASVKRTKIARAELQTDRKLNQVAVYCDGSIWATTDPLLHSGRFTWRYKSLDRTSAELWMWNGHVDRDTDEYGQYQATHEKIPLVEKSAAADYDSIVMPHEHRPSTDEEDFCVSML
jgi:hypothetical protein